MILDQLYDLALWPHPWPWPWSFKVRVWNSFILGMGRPIDNERKGCESSIHDHDVWLVWPWWGGQMYWIVTGVTSDVGVPSTYLVSVSIMHEISYNGLVPSRWQANICISDDPVHWCYVVSLGLNELEHKHFVTEICWMVIWLWLISYYVGGDLWYIWLHPMRLLLLFFFQCAYYYAYDSISYLYTAASVTL